MVFFFGDPYFGALANPAVIDGSCGDGLMEEALAWPSGPCHGRYGSMLKGLHLQASADHYDITADLPGFKPEDIKVELLGRNRMAVTAEIKQSSETKANDADADQGRRVSRKLQRSFRQVMKLPSDVDEAGVSARVEHGVLSVVVPRRKDLPDGPRIIPVLDAKAEASHQADDAQPGVTAKDEEMARD